MVECLNADDFSKALALIRTKLPIKQTDENEDTNDILTFLTLTHEEEMFMVVNKK